MPAYAHPATARVNNDLVIHVQCHDCRAAYRGQPGDACPSRIPRKVITPVLCAGIKEGGLVTCQGIEGNRSAAFEFVAAPSIGSFELRAQIGRNVKPAHAASRWLSGEGIW